MNRRYETLVSLARAAAVLGLVASLSACPDTIENPPTADAAVEVTLDATAEVEVQVDAGPCPAGASENACGGCDTLSGAADNGAPGSLCQTADGFDGVSTCQGTDAVVCSALAQNACGGTATLEGPAGTPCGACERGVWTCDTPDTVSCVGGAAGVNACGGCLILEAAPQTACGGCAGVWTCDSEGTSVTCEGDTLNTCGGCAELTGPGPGALCNGNGTVACDGVDATVCSPAGGNACGGSAVLADVPGTACGDCDDGLVVCSTQETTACIGASVTNACGGCGFLGNTPGEACAPTGIWICEGQGPSAVLGCSFSGGNGCGGTAVLVNSEDPDANVVLGSACGVCDAGALACLGFDATQCVGGRDEDSYVWPDEDEDGYGDAAATPVVECAPGPKTATQGGDCDDSEPTANPGPAAVEAGEVCDGLDNDCNGQTDEGTAGVVCTADSGCGGLTVCGGAAGITCDAVVSADEVCDGVDNNCDGEVDEADADGCVVVYFDGDVDGFGLTDQSACLCPGNADGYAPDDGDCDDTRPEVTPESFEVCNGLDDDCDGTTDIGAADAEVWYPDVDEDTFGDPAGPQQVCEVPDGWVANALDCDDGDAAVHPSTVESTVAELCDGIDNDCDGATDPDVSLGTHAFRADNDGDSFSGGTNFLVQCFQPDGYLPTIDGVAIAAGAEHGVVIGGIGELSAWGGPNGSPDALLATGRMGLDVDSGNGAVAAGDGFTLALGVDGTIHTWGITEAPEEAAIGVDMVAAGDGHALALLSDGTVVAWGANNEQQTDVVAGLVDVAAVAAGGNHSLALRVDGTVAAWGRNVELQTDVPAGLADVQAIAAGGAHSLALLGDGTLVAWGLGDDGQTTIPSVLAGVTVTAVAAGGAHNVALLDDGTVVAFGADDAGQVSVPNGLSNVVAVAAGEAFSMALSANGTVWAWGDDAAGQRTVPDTLRRDCNDNDSLIHPNADDICDFVDNDCDGADDMEDSQGVTPWYADVDGDLHGDINNVVLGCLPATSSAAPFGFLQSPVDDCDDLNPETWPGAPELVADGIDQDCDLREWCYIDGDADGAPLNFTQLMASAEGDLLCTGTSTDAVQFDVSGGFSYVPASETPITLGTAGVADCNDIHPEFNYGVCPAFLFVDTPMTWADADAHCASVYGTHLASVQSYADTFNSNFGSTSWIGANDIASEGTYVWSGGEPWDYTNWGGLSPTGDDQHNCVTQFGTTRLWADQDCAELYPFACAAP